MSTIASVGKAENQPISPETWDAAQEEIARLSARVRELEAKHDAEADCWRFPLPEGISRMESGPVCFGDDWRGYFLRGDAAFSLLTGRDTVLSLLKSGDTRPSTLLWANSSLGAIPDMARCIHGGVRFPVTEQPAEPLYLPQPAILGDGADSQGTEPAQ